jgi:hypothetical protein
MTQYLMSVHGNEEIYAAVSPQDRQKMYSQVDAFNNELRESGAWVFAGGLQLASTATVVNVKDGKTIIAKGPYMKTTEHIGGFWVITASDLDAALVWAAKGSAACMSPVEVRPFQEELNED